MKKNILKNTLKSLVVEEEAIGVVEIILILVILVALVLLFGNQIKTIVTEAFSKITTNTGKIKKVG